jgi:hypothetical protein
MKSVMRLQKNLILILALILSLFGTALLKAQDQSGKDALRVFTRIEEGIADCAVDKFSKFFGSKNYISLANGTAGYYSANQSYYVIKDFLSINTPTSFKLTNTVTETSTPFASGILKYSSNGIRKTATVFLMLQIIENHWHISQITIN